jgi:DNA-binding HxlR family transcriptional regulator
MAPRGERERLRAMSFKRSRCPVACTLDVIGDKWSLLIVRDLLLGRSSYSEFLNAGEGIPTNILARRLRRLEEAGLVEKRVARGPRRRFEYRLTATGRGLGPIVKVLVEWGRSQIRGTRSPAPPGSTASRR